MNSTLVRFNNKSYYVDYDDLLNKANDKLFAYEDEELTKNAKLNGKTLMFDKSKLEDKLKGDIKMKSRMPGAAKTENVSIDKEKFEKRIYILKLLKLLNSKTKEIVDNIKNNADIDTSTFDDILQWIKDDAYELIPELRPVAPKTTTDWHSHEHQYSELVDGWSQKVAEKFFKEKKMTTEQKLREYIREIIREALKENIDTRATNKADIWIPGASDSSDPQDDVDYIKSKLKQKGINANVSYSIDEFYINLENKSKIKHVAKILDSLGYQYYVNKNVKEDAPDGRPDEEYYLFGSSMTEEEESEGPSAEELAAKQKAAEEQKRKQAYNRFFSQALAKFGYSSPASIPDEKKKQFYDYIDANWTSKQEAPIDETSATGGVAGYETPRAFTGQKGVSKKQKDIANQLGYELIDKSYAVKENLTEGLDSYYFKDENLRPEQKLGLAMRQVRNNLSEVEKIVQKTIKMKNEEDVDSSKVGKRTYSALRRINEKVIRLMVALQELK